ncbi:dihydroorotase [Roseofilum sp. BLCC_M154]|uniref:Dihydroorotase n=1 Tax=Roseofilum acuticapitatum BLCC-M154 TaxID=3022444 RepID=A0ABT7AND5_9CYAN|nr:dihydroorotase [Roseofilum acuticapitatum]MDJ1168401.1 dihydroorotase [Roseofilum acuticapitatum BLCC-M154]
MPPSPEHAMSTLLKQVRAINPIAQTDQIQDVWLDHGEIKAMGDSIHEYPPETQVQDGQGLIVGPGLVDLYSQSGQPGFEERETLESLVHAARAGGFIRVGVLPTTDPPIDNPATVALLKGKTPQYLGVQLSFWGALTQGAKGQQMNELGELAGAGVVGFSDGQAIANLLLLRRLLEYAGPLGKPVAIWPLAVDLAADGVMREGHVSTRLGLPGIPAAAETAALAALLELVAQTRTRVHIMRVSTARSVQLIQEAKEGGLPVTASTPWMHLLLDTEAISSQNTGGFMPYDPSFRLAAPLGNPEDREALIWGIRQGVIDAIAIDHTPYTYEEKTVGFETAPMGAIGLELALPLLWQGLVVTGELSAVQLWRSLSTYPALCLNQTAPSLNIGQPAELIVFDPQVSWTPDRTTLKSLASNTPWLYHTLQGRVMRRFDVYPEIN